MSETLREAIEAAVRAADAAVPWAGKASLEPYVSIVLGERPWRRAPDALPGWRSHAIGTALAAHPEASLAHVVRLGMLDPESRPWNGRFTEELRLWCAARAPLDLDALVRVLEAEKMPTDDVLVTALDLVSSTTPASLRQVLELHASELPNVLAAREAWVRARRFESLMRALDVVGPSETLSAALLPFAVDAPREMRPALRAYLQSVPSTRIAERLASRSKDEREAVATWLGERKDPAAVPALRGALKKEKHEGVRAALMGALVACGAQAPIDPATLEADATKRLAKGWPDALAFIDAETLPALRWTDGSVVAPAIVRAWILGAYASKDPEPSPLVRLVARRIEPADAALLARTMLDRWIAWDTRMPIDLTADEEERVAMIMANWARGQTREQLFARPDARNLGLPTRGAVAEKGVLGIVAALGDGALVPVIDAYVRTHRGFRASQSRAMLTVLSWMDDARATQALLRFAAGFRTPGIQKEARLLADLLASRRGWTMAELADRTVPSAGLDDEGKLTIVYGRGEDRGEDVDVIATRTFVARLDEGDQLVLEDAEGSRIASLPDARKDEDEQVVATAKKRFATAKKELKALFASQRDRLYEAMLGQRTWPLADFEAYVLAHPVLGRLARRVIFTASVGEGPLVTFRPAGDGSFVDASNDTVALDRQARIGVAHGTLIPSAIASAWAQHLGDYELLPLFAQLGREEPPASQIRDTLMVPEARAGLLAIEVRSRSKRAGYAERRGDGGYIDAFVKSLPTLGRMLVLQTEGIEPMAAKNATVVVTGLVLSAEGHDTIAWSRAGSVMRAEAWAELCAIVR